MKALAIFVTNIIAGFLPVSEALARIPRGAGQSARMANLAAQSHICINSNLVLMVAAALILVLLFLMFILRKKRTAQILITIAMVFIALGAGLYLKSEEQRIETIARSEIRLVIEGYTADGVFWSFAKKTHLKFCEYKMNNLPFAFVPVNDKDEEEAKKILKANLDSFRNVQFSDKKRKENWDKFVSLLNS